MSVISTMATPSSPASMLPRSPTWRWESFGPPCFSWEESNSKVKGGSVGWLLPRFKEFDEKRSDHNFHDHSSDNDLYGMKTILAWKIR